MMERLRNALMDVVCTFSMDSPLAVLSRPRYGREIIITEAHGDRVTVALLKRGFGYKYRGRKIPAVPADVEGIKAEINNRSPPWLTVLNVIDEGEKVVLELEVKEDED